ncbi:MAG: methyltransferase domain-containing protein [Terriglobales bacterium]|jgi:SAM-dependent methyltransferase
MTITEFDQFADTYDDDLNRALSASGETKEFFARGRVDHLRSCLLRLNHRPQTVLDYGCGVGDTSPLLRDLLGAESVVGLDVSVRSLDVANVRYKSPVCSFATFDDFAPSATIDLAYCNGVFHHIPIIRRAAAVDFVYRCLRPGGIFALWENNPWNPGTRYVMSQCVFDQDAITLNSLEARRMLVSRGFEPLGTDYLFFFPTLARALRFLEPHLSRVPFGAQYQVLCQKPLSAQSATGPVSGG